MPSVDKSRVKTSGTGAIVYSNADSGAVTTEATPTDLPILSVTGENIGEGVGIYRGTNGQDHVILDFKTLVEGEGIYFIETNEEIIISTNANAVAGDGGHHGTAFDNAFEIPLGNANSVANSFSWSNGAVALANALNVSYAIDQLNFMLGLLVPAQPANFPNSSLSILGATGNLPVLALGVIDNGNTGVVAGNAVTRVATSTVSSNVFSGVGPALHGTLELLLNDNFYSTHTLTSGNNNGSYNGILITNQRDYPTQTPGFWKSIDVQASNVPVPLGASKIKMIHTDAGSTSNAVFVRDDLNSTGNITNASVTEISNGTMAYSSSVPHYGLNGSLKITAAVSNLSGQTYYGGADPFTVSGTNNVISGQAFTYSNLGISTPIIKDTTSPTQIANVTVNVDGSVHASGQVQAVFKNVVGSSSATNLSNKIILVKRGVASSSRVDEMLIPVTGLGNLPNSNYAARVSCGSGDTPNNPITTWVPTDALPTWEAAVVGGVLQHCQIDFSSGGYLPVGPNLSAGRSGSQYATFMFARATVSTFKINVTGTYTDCFVKLVGVSDNSGISPHSAGGWWKASTAYNGAGVPGNASDLSAGCASGAVMNGTSGNYIITFGTQSSSNASGNDIVVRFKLAAGQSITSLSFTNN